MTTLDADRLEELGRSASDLLPTMFKDLGTLHLSESMARFRVFAEVLKATEANLSVLTRVSSEERLGSMANPVSSWGR